MFIEAIKSNSLNSRAKEIIYFEGIHFEGNDSEINYQLLTSVLKFLELEHIKNAGLRNLSSLDQLLGILVELLNKHNDYFSKQISSDYEALFAFAAPRDGGSSSSSVSKKSRKSHKSYHPGIGKTKKHHHSHHKKISFVH